MNDYRLIILLPEEISSSDSLLQRWAGCISAIAQREVRKRDLLESKTLHAAGEGESGHSVPNLIPHINPGNIRDLILGHPPTALIYASATATPSEQQAAILRECISEHIPIIPLVFSPPGLEASIPEILHAYQTIDYHGQLMEFLSRIARAVGNAFALSGTNKVFISYSRGSTDKAAAQLFCQLSSRHYSTFMDVYSINPPCVFQDKLCAELLTSDVIILLCAEDSEESSWMKYEANLAFFNNIGIILVKWNIASPRMEQFADKIFICNDFEGEDNKVPIFHDNNLSYICNLVDYVSTCAHNRKKLTILEKAALETHQTWALKTGYDAQKSVYSYAVSKESDQIIIPITRIPNIHDFHRAKLTFRNRPFSLACHFTAELRRVELDLDWISHSTSIPLTNYHH